MPNILELFEAGDLLREDGQKPPRSYIQLMIRCLGVKGRSKHLWPQARTADFYRDELNCISLFFQKAMATEMPPLTVRLKHGARFCRRLQNKGGQCEIKVA